MSHRNILLITIIRFAQSFHLYIHVYALILLNRGLNLFQITTIESIVIGTIFVMEVPTGIIADRIGRKWSIIASTLFMMFAEFLFLFANSYPMYIIVAILTGTGFAFASGAIEATVYDSLPEENRDDLMKRAMGRINSWSGIAFFIAPLVGAFIIADGSPNNYTVAIALTVIALVIGLLISLFLEEPPTDWDAERTSSLDIFKEGIAEVRDNPTLKRLIALIIFSTPFTATLVVTLAAPHLTNNGTDPFFVGIALSIGSLLAAITQHYAYKVEEWLGQRTAIWVLLLLPAVLYGFLAIAVGPIAPVLVIIIMYATNDMKAPLFSAYQNSLIGSKNRATVLSIISMFGSLFVAVVAPIYAAIGTVSLPITFVVMGAVIAVATLLIGIPELNTQERVQSIK
ncbi:MAG: MFS transporter [Chloroflexota bacterium]